MLASGILLGGVFAPLLTIPLLGGFSYFDYMRLMLQTREEWNLETWFTEGEPSAVAFRIASVGFGLFGAFYLLGALLKLRAVVKFFAFLMLLCLGTCFVTIVGELNPPMDPEAPVETLVFASVKQSWGWAVLLIACVLPLLPLESKPIKTSVESAATPQAGKDTSAVAEALENLHDRS